MFFSRGRGRGHALPDLTLVSHLHKADPALDIQLVSYGTGAATIRRSGYSVVDLGLPDDNSFVETLVRITRLICESRPALVVSHEEFAAIPAARSFGISSMFLTDWFPPLSSVMAECLIHAEEILFMDDPGYFDEPARLRGRVSYVGPVLRDLNVEADDRRLIREQFGLAGNTALLMVLPGGSRESTEEKSPILDLVVGATQLIPSPSFVVWIASEPELQFLRARAKGLPNIAFVEPHPTVERLMFASDVVITKGTRKTSLELAQLGVPSISISYGLNPIDDCRVAHIRTNRALRARGLSCDVLGSAIARALSERVSSKLSVPSLNDGKSVITSRIVSYLKATGGHPHGLSPRA